MTEKACVAPMCLSFIVMVFISVLAPSSTSAGFASDTVWVSIPDVWASPGQTIMVPVSISPVTVTDEIYALKATFTYDRSLLTGVTVKKEQTLTEVWSPQPTSNVIENMLLVAFGGEYPIDGSGALITLVFQVADSAEGGQTSPIRFDTFSLNEGRPRSVAHDALFTVGEEPSIGLSESEHDFGMVRLGNTAEWTLSMSNRGGAELIVIDIHSTLAQFGVKPIQFPVQLPAGESRDVGISFWPVSEDTLMAGLRITCNDPLQPVATVALSGFGASPGTAVDDPSSLNHIPNRCSLSQNYPNPFNAGTTISFTISAQERTTTHHSPLTSLKIFNLLGQEVRTLVNGVKRPGYYSVAWDGRDDTEREMPSGVYLYRLTSRDFVETKRMIYIR